MIEVKHLCKRYGEHVAVDDLSFTIENGHVYGFLGPNGAGKSTTIQKTLARYEDLSKHVKVEKINPVANPNFAYAYMTEDLYNNSLVVTSAAASKSRYISYYDIYESSYDEEYNTVTSYNGEGALTAAVNFVTSDTQTRVYYLSGHGEDELPSNLVSSFENGNISLTQLNLLTEENIPPDCAALLLYSPASDLSQEEIDKIEAHLAENGSLMLFTDCDAEDLPRLHAMMAKRGVEAVDGMVVEGDSSYFMSNYPNYLIPQLENHEITEPLISGNYYVLMPMTQGLKITAQTDETEQAEADETDASLSVNALLSTTADAYSKIKGLQATDADTGDSADSDETSSEAEEDGDTVSTAQEIVDGVRGLNFETCVTYKADKAALASYGLDKPQMSFTVKGKQTADDGGSTAVQFTLQVESKIGSSYYVRLKDSKMVYTVSADEINALCG